MPFEPIRTERLLIRAMRAEDVDAYWEWRNHPKVAEYQTWTLPFPRETAERHVLGAAEMDGPANDEWWTGAVELAETSAVLGEVVVNLSWEGRSAEVGFSFHPDNWGHGYAVEALDALVDHLFDDLGVTRVYGMLHPDNRASAMVLERVGMLFEGHTRLSFWVDDDVSDDWIYGMTREDRETWKTRPRGRPDTVELREITGADFGDVYFLRTHKSQESFVAPMPKSLSQALLARSDPDHPADPWYRAIAADGRIVGFVMVAMPIPGEEEEEPFLWRLLIDRLHQRRGVASMALGLVEDEMRSLGHTAWKTSWVPGRGSPEPFYLANGFEPTGEMEGQEVVARKEL